MITLICFSFNFPTLHPVVCHWVDISVTSCCLVLKMMRAVSAYL
jgi:hypothetical protein